jgi:hypothetical protein
MHSSRPALVLPTCGVFCLLALLSSIPAHAKDPAPDWAVAAAKTPTPASAKDAPAVVLLDEYLITVDSQNHAVERERSAVRILQPQGRKYSRCDAWYDVDSKLNYIRSWTITADGRQLQAMEQDFTDYGAYENPIMQLTQRVRAAKSPASDPGNVVICETESHNRPYISEEEWGIQQSIPVVFEALELDLAPGGHYAAAWRKFPPVTPTVLAPGHIRWEIKDVPALDLENMHAIPSWEALAARMSVKWGDEAVEGKDNQWRAIGQWTTALEEHRPDPTPEITAKALELTAGATDFYSKLSRIADFVQKNIRYFIVMRGIGGFQAHYAGDIYRNRYGDCKDKATIVISMLQAVGIHAVYVPVDDHRGIVDPDEPSLVGNHMITAIEIPPDVNDPRLQAIAKAKDGNRYLIFDPTNEHTAIGNLPYYLQGGYGTLAAGPASQVIALPVLGPDASGTEQKGSFTLSADGTLAGSVDAFHSGSEGAEFREFLKETDDKERREIWEHYVASSLPGVTLDAFQFTQPGDLDKPLEFHYKVTAGQYAHAAGPLLLVRPRVVGSFSRSFDSKPRTLPINLVATGHWHDSFDIALPPGYVVDEMPDPAGIDLDFASYHSTITVKGSQLHYDREYIVRQVELPPERAADFRHLESVIVADERSAAVLKKQ